MIACLLIVYSLGFIMAAEDLSQPRLETDSELLIDPIEVTGDSVFRANLREDIDEENYEDSAAELSLGYLPPPPSQGHLLQEESTLLAREKSLIGQRGSPFARIFNLDSQFNRNAHPRSRGFENSLNNDFQSAFLEQLERERQQNQFLPEHEQLFIDDGEESFIFDNLQAERDLQELSPGFFNAPKPFHNNVDQEFGAAVPTEFIDDLTPLGSQQHLQFALPEFSEGSQLRNRRHHQKNPYQFQYGVNDPHSGSDYSRQESSDGDTVTGEYRVLLPDGRLQIVSYTADEDNGYNAVVRYEPGSFSNSQTSGNFNNGFQQSHSIGSHNSFSGSHLQQGSDLDSLQFPGRFTRPLHQSGGQIHHQTKNRREESLRGFGTGFSVEESLKQSYDKEYSAHHKIPSSTFAHGHQR